MFLIQKKIPIFEQLERMRSKKTSQRTLKGRLEQAFKIHQQQFKEINGAIFLIR